MLQFLANHFLRVFAAVVFAACFISVGTAEEGPIKVGVVTPHSPPGSIAQGSEARVGVKIAAQMINNQGGLLGRKIKLIQEDSRGVPGDGRSAAERLITKDNVDLLTGGVHSSVCMAMSDVVHKHHVVFMNVNCWSDAVREKGYPEWWNTSVNNSRIAIGGAKTIAAWNAQSVVALAENTDFGIGLAKKLGKQLDERAPDIKYDYRVVDRESKDFSSQLLSLKNERPDIVVPIMDPPGGYIIINQLYQQGIAPSSKTALLDLDALAGLPDFWDNVGKAGVGMAGFVLFHPDMKLTDLGKKVAKIRKQQSGKEPNRLVFQGFDALWSLKDAVERAGSLKTNDVIQALKNTKLEGSRGTITFNLDKGPLFQQWVDVPYAVIQYEKKGQELGDAPIVAPADQKTADYQKPKSD